MLAEEKDISGDLEYLWLTANSLYGQRPGNLKFMGANEVCTDLIIREAVISPA
jgi:hypothetical protein